MQGAAHTFTETVKTQKKKGCLTPAEALQKKRCGIGADKAAQPLLNTVGGGVSLAIGLHVQHLFNQIQTNLIRVKLYMGDLIVACVPSRQNKPF